MEPANMLYEMRKGPKKDWREISKFQAFFITLFIVSLYAYAHWEIIKDGYFWKVGLTITFAIGIAFGFLVNIKPGKTDNLVFNHQELCTKWNNGLCFVPSLFPFLHRINLRILWSLKEIHHEESSDQEKEITFNHSVNLNSANITQTKTEVNFWTLKYWEMGVRILNWFISKHKNPVFVYQDFGFKIIVIVFILDCFSLTTASVVTFFSPKEKNVLVQDIQSQPNQQPIQTEKEKIYLMPNGDLVIMDGGKGIIIPPTFPMHKDNSNQSKCEWTETDWNLDLIYENYLDVSKLGGCIDFHPPRGKQVGLFFNDRPIKTAGDFTVSSRYDEKICYFSSKDDCLDFIGSHLNQTLVFEGVHIYVDTGK